MNNLNHFIFSLSLCLLFLELSPINLVYIFIFSLLFSNFLDLDHKLNKKAPWYKRRTWVQEPFGVILIGLPLAFLLSSINRNFFALVLIPYSSHVFLDYLCIFETSPLAPFWRVRKKEGLGIFVPDNLFVKSENSLKWAKRVKIKKLKGISENYFTLINLLFFTFVLLLKIPFQVT